MFNLLSATAEAVNEGGSGTIVGDIILVAILVTVVAVLSFIYIKRKKDDK